jgi:hypothetical protein
MFALTNPQEITTTTLPPDNEVMETEGSVATTPQNETQVKKKGKIPPCNNFSKII